MATDRKGLEDDSSAQRPRSMTTPPQSERWRVCYADCECTVKRSESAWPKEQAAEIAEACAKCCGLKHWIEPA